MSELLAILSLVVVFGSPVCLILYVILFVVASRYEQTRKKQFRIKALLIFLIPFISLVTLVVLIFVANVPDTFQEAQSTTRCLALDTVEKKNLCLAGVAVANNNYKICDVMDSSQPYWKDFCYASEAIHKKDASLCMQAGSFKDKCYSTLAQQSK